MYFNGLLCDIATKRSTNSLSGRQIFLNWLLLFVFQKNEKQ